MEAMAVSTITSISACGQWTSTFVLKKQQDFWYTAHEDTMKNIKLFICDLDGTLLNSRHQVSEQMVELIQTIRAQGHYFGIATGRPDFSAIGVFKELKDICDVLVFYNGGGVHDFIDHETMDQFPLMNNHIQEIIAIGKTLGGNPILYDNNIMYTEREDFYSLHAEETGYGKVVFTDITTVIKQQHPKILFSADEATMNRLNQYVAENPHDTYRGFQSQKDLFEFVDQRVNKLLGIEWFCNRHAIDLREVMAFGDNDNDFEMIAGCGVGVAMKNATDKVKQAADVIIQSNDDDGIYHYLVDYLMD